MMMMIIINRIIVWITSITTGSSSIIRSGILLRFFLIIIIILSSPLPSCSGWSQIALYSTTATTTTTTTRKSSSCTMIWMMSKITQQQPNYRHRSYAFTSTYYYHPTTQTFISTQRRYSRTGSLSLSLSSSIIISLSKLSSIKPVFRSLSSSLLRLEVQKSSETYINNDKDNNNDNNNINDTKIIQPILIRRIVELDNNIITNNNKNVGLKNNNKRQQRTTMIRNRIIPITNNWTITVWEWDNPIHLIESYWEQENNNYNSNNMKSDTDPNIAPDIIENKGEQYDPFGLVAWPGAVIAVQELAMNNNNSSSIVQNQRVLIFGAGVGIETQAVLELGASYVVATDIHPHTIQLLQYGIQYNNNINNGNDTTNKNNNTTTTKFETRILDVTNPNDVITTVFNTNTTTSSNTTTVGCNYDLIVIADVLYNDYLASNIAHRCYEIYKKAYQNNVLPPRILISDSQRFVHLFENEINILFNNLLLSQQQQNKNNNQQQQGQFLLKWETRSLIDFTGSGVLINDDQTYTVQARIMWINR